MRTLRLCCLLARCLGWRPPEGVGYALSCFPATLRTCCHLAHVPLSGAGRGVGARLDAGAARLLERTEAAHAGRGHVLDLSAIPEG